MIKTNSTDCTFPISDFEQMKEKVLNWSQQFNTFSFLDNHQYQIEPHSMECLLAAGVKRQLKADASNALNQLQEFIDYQSDPRFGGAAILATTSAGQSMEIRRFFSERTS